MPEVNQEYRSVKGGTKVFPECRAAMNYSPRTLILDGSASGNLMSQRENAEMENKTRLGDVQEVMSTLARAQEGTGSYQRRLISTDKPPVQAKQAN